MPVSEHDRRYMQRLAEAFAELERETGPASPEFQRWVIRFANERRAQHGLPLFEEDDDEQPELESFPQTRRRGMYRR